MSARNGWSVLAPLGVCALLAGWIALSVANSRTVGFSLLLYAIANLVVYTDALDLALRLYVRRRSAAGVGQVAAGEPLTDVSIDLDAIVPPETRLLVPVAPYAIIGSVFNLEDRLEAFFESFAPYKDRMWLISDGSTDNTVLRLTQAGWRCFDGGVNRKKPGAIRRLLERLPRHIETVMVIDPDVRIAAPGSTIDVHRFISDFQQSDAAAACPRIMIEPDGLLARFQAFEYALSFCIGRRSLTDYNITSGAASIYRRDALA
jgi:cellulose synthase/poly-beta-1,6-N-acetylglucosamine synthase-like glycosyltransferase